MKVGPKSSLRPFLHRALQLDTYGLNAGRYFVEMLALKMRRNAYEVFVFDLARLLQFISEQSVSECTIAQLQTSLYSRHGMNIGRWLVIVFTNF